MAVEHGVETGMVHGVVHRQEEGSVPVPEELELARNETHVLEYPPTCGNGIVWNKDDGRIAIASGGLVVVVRPDGKGVGSHAVGLVTWKEGVPCLGDDEECFIDYLNCLNMYTDGLEDDGKKSVSKSTSQDVARGRTFGHVKEMLERLSRVDSESDRRKIQTSIMVSELMDDAYFNSESPKVVSLAWSPGMCSSLGGSLLGVVFDDSSTILYSISESMSVLWTPVLQLSRYREVHPGELPSVCVGIAWSEEIVYSTSCFSILGVVLGNGSVDLYRVAHVEMSLDGENLDQRIVCVGTIEIPDECITQIRFAVMHEMQEFVAVCGCRSGVVVAWSEPWSSFIDMSNTIDENLITVREDNHLRIVDHDDLMVSSLDCSITRDASGNAQSLLISVGKTVGVVQLYLGDDLNASESTLASLRRGGMLQVPRTIDCHTVSGLACLMNGKLVVATSRLGNILTLKIPENNSKSATIGLNPVHHNTGPGMASYKGYGYYGIAASPGGNFVALARQAQEPDQAFRRQLQIHQMITQGYLHIQSVVGPGAEVPCILDALKCCIDGWVQSTIGRASLWDIERLAVLSERMDQSGKEIAKILQMLQDKAGIGLNAQNMPCILTKISIAHVAVLIHALRVIQNQQHSKILSISDLEMVMMKDVVWNLITRSHDGDDTWRLSALLALDFVVSHQKSHGWIFTDNMVQKTKETYSILGEDEYVEEEPPKRQISASIKNLMATMRSGSVEESLRASVLTNNNTSEEPCVVMRCPATLLGMLDGGEWSCQSCHRSFSQPTRPMCFSHGNFACPLCAGIVELDKHFYS